MTIEFKLPEVSEGVESVDIAEVMVSPGDTIDAGTVICEVETDKAVAEIECPHAGTIKEVLFSEGDSVSIGSGLLIIDESVTSDASATVTPSTPNSQEPAVEEQEAEEPTPVATAAVKTSSVVEFALQEVSEGVTAVDVAEVMVSTGDTIQAGATICEVETDKAVAEIECPHAGTITAVHISNGDNVAIGAPLISIETTETTSSTADSNKPAAPATPATTPPTQPTAASPPIVNTGAAAAPINTAQPPPPAGPATRRLARKLGVDLTLVTGSARGGRITIEDVEGFVRERLSHPAGGGIGSRGSGMIQAAPLPDFSQFGQVERESLNKIYRAAASNLHNSWLTIPHVTQHEMADVTELEIARKRYVQSNPKSPKITMTAITIKAVVGALKAFPHFNSSLDMDTGEWVLKRYYHIGVAVDTPKGLVVPVIRNCDQKNVLQVAAELGDLAERARDRKLKAAEMRGASFTITNLGGVGGTYFTPIVNHPEVAILGLSRGQKTPKLENGELTERLMLPLSLSYDHRAINGAEAARFIVKLSGSLTNLFELF
jgi:pyruvate dehydrogenase E2 component (dihydrolipoamide acetyltransferase)